MNFEKSTERCGIPFGLYRVDHDYINSLREKDSNILSPDDNDLYCGPVYHATCERGSFGFFVPVDEKAYNEATAFLAMFSNGILDGIYDYNKMITIVHERFLTLDTSNEDLVIFCKNGKDEMEKCGDVIITAKKENKPCPTLMF